MILKFVGHAFCAKNKPISDLIGGTEFQVGKAYISQDAFSPDWYNKGRVLMAYGRQEAIEMH